MKASRVTTIAEHAQKAEAALGSEIIEGIGGPGDVFEIFGDEGTGKTRLALGLAAALISAPTWGPFRIRRNGPVLLLESDMSERAQARIEKEFLDAGYFGGGGLFVPDYNTPRAHYHVRADGNTVKMVQLQNISPDLSAVLLDTWTSTFSADMNPYVEQSIRAVVEQFRRDYPTALIVALNHTTGGTFTEQSRSLSPGLRRLATARYRILRGAADPKGRWKTDGRLVVDGKGGRSPIPQEVGLHWDWDSGSPCPLPTAEVPAWTPRQALEMFGRFPNQRESASYASQRDALRELSQFTGVPEESLRTEQRRHPNPVLAALVTD